MPSASPHHPHPAATPTRTGVPWFIWTSAITDPAVDHAVTDEAMYAGINAAQGTYRATCGTTFVPAPLIAAPAHPCPACLATLGIATPPAANQRTGAARARRRGRHHAG